MAVCLINIYDAKKYLNLTLIYEKIYHRIPDSRGKYLLLDAGQIA